MFNVISLRAYIRLSLLNRCWYMFFPFLTGRLSKLSESDEYNHMASGAWHNRWKLWTVKLQAIGKIIPCSQLIFILFGRPSINERIYVNGVYKEYTMFFVLSNIQIGLLHLASVAIKSFRFRKIMTYEVWMSIWNNNNFWTNLHICGWQICNTIGWNLRIIVKTSKKYLLLCE